MISRCASVRSLDQAGILQKSRPRTIKKLVKRPPLTIKSVAKLATENLLVRSASNENLPLAREDALSMILRKRNQAYYGSSESLNQCQSSSLAGSKSLQNLHQFNGNARHESRGLENRAPLLRRPSSGSMESITDSLSNDQLPLTSAKSMHNLHQFKDSTRLENRAPLKRPSSSSMESVNGRPLNDAGRTFSNGSWQSTNESDTRYSMVANNRLSRFREKLHQNENAKQNNGFAPAEKSTVFNHIEKSTSTIPPKGFAMMKERLKQHLFQEANLEKSKENECSQNGSFGVPPNERQQYYNRSNLNQEARSASLMRKKAYKQNVGNNFNSFQQNKYYFDQTLPKNVAGIRLDHIQGRLKCAAAKK